MTKTYVLDTNVLLSDPNSIFNFGEHDVVVPLVTLEELDGKKQDQSEIGRNARAFGRIIDQLREQGDLRVCVRLGDKKGCLRVDSADEESLAKIPGDLDSKKADAKILAVAIKNSAILVTRDILLRIMSDSLGVQAEDYKHDKIKNSGEEYKGTRIIDVASDVVSEIYQEGGVQTSDFYYPNEYVLFRDSGNNKSSVMVRYDESCKGVVQVNAPSEVWGISPKNLEQTFAIDALLDPQIKLVTISGIAGSGKTLISLACALYQTLDLQLYKKIFFSRPIISIGNTLGFLPGSLQEKLQPWVAPVLDNLSVIMDSNGQNQSKKTKKKTKASQDCDEKAVGVLPMVSEFMLQGVFEFSAIEHLRGRTIPGFIILDEAQNTSKHEIKTIISRAAEGTKIVLLGDLDQIDSPYLDSTNNGLAHTIDKFKNESIAAHIQFSKGERSQLATLASELL